MQHANHEPLPERVVHAPAAPRWEQSGFDVIVGGCSWCEAVPRRV
jgi:hypothetical protein